MLLSKEKQELVTKISDMVLNEIYKATILEMVYILGIEGKEDEITSKRDIAKGKAFAGIFILDFLTERKNVGLLNEGMEDAMEDAEKAGDSVPKLLLLIVGQEDLT